MTNKKRAAVKLLQGYLWHPKNEELILKDYLPETLAENIYLLWDEMPMPPFTFFDDGSLASEQQFYQLTLIQLLANENTKAEQVQTLAENLQNHLEKTPKSLGWQIFEDLRDL